MVEARNRRTSTHARRKPPAGGEGEQAQIWGEEGGKNGGTIDLLRQPNACERLPSFHASGLNGGLLR